LASGNYVAPSCRSITGHTLEPGTW